MIHLGDCEAWLRSLPSNSMDSCVVDPPYGLGKPPEPRYVLTSWLAGQEIEVPGGGFMGHAWDSFVPSPMLWAEVFRVMKPGAHIVCYAGQRTFAWMGTSLQLGGFELRDLIGWLYYNGMPKAGPGSLSASFDRRRTSARPDILRVTAWVRAARDAAGLKNRDIDQAFNTRGMAGHWTSQRKQPAIPTAEQWRILVGLVGEPPAEIEELAARLNAAKGSWENERHDREVVDKSPSVVLDGTRNTVNAGTPITDLAQKWAGFGTQLKPAIEPAWLARKPFSGTVADNVETWGVGALNVDACRIALGDPIWPGPQDNPDTKRPGNAFRGRLYGEGKEQETNGGHPGGRFPANVMHCTKVNKRERYRGSSDNEHPTLKPVRLLRRQVRLVTPPGGKVLDPFGGSGSCGVASILEGFEWHAAEVDPRWHAVAVERTEHARNFPEEWADTEYRPGETETETETETEPEPRNPAQYTLF